ncbi:MAG: PLP-dependent aminotransferase family protein [Clostridiales bacterium]|nr:PLP-dependent aminotransferase family protein [Clostridiales bacterium]
MNFENFKLKKGGNAEPLYKQLAFEILKEIETGVIKPGEKLPPVRSLTSQLGVNASTVVSAYKLLETRRAVYSRRGSGTYAAELNSSKDSFPLHFKDEDEEKNISEGINFTASSLPTELFPLGEFKKALNEVLDEEKGAAFGYEDPRGSLPLRKTLAERKGVNLDNVQIISGAQQGTDLIARALLTYGDTVFTENPTYGGAVSAFKSRGAEVIGINILPDGIDTDELQRLIPLYKPKLVYVMTYFQTPTAYSCSLKKKRRLLELAYEYGFYIIEEDNLCDFNYSDKEILSLKALDYKNRVIYIKSFSKVLMPGLRLGYMIMPAAVKDSVIRAKFQADMGSSGFVQLAFDRYLKSGSFDRHIVKIREYYKQKYSLMCRLLDKYIKPFADYTKPGGGLSFMIKLKIADPLKLKTILEEKGIFITVSENSAGNNKAPSPVKLSFADITNEAMEEGLREINLILKSI